MEFDDLYQNMDIYKMMTPRNGMNDDDFRSESSLAEIENMDINDAFGNPEVQTR